MSNLFRLVVRSFFDDAGHNLQTSGMIIKFTDGSQPTMLWAALAVKVADESALHQVWLNKGAGGIMLCLLCSNVVSDDSGLAMHDARHELVPSTCLEFGRFVLHTGASIRALLARIAAFAEGATKTALEEFEKQVGFSHCPESILMDPALSPYVDPCRITMYDWCHVFLVSGLFQLIVGLLMRLLHPQITYSDLNEFIRAWTLPKRYESSADGMDVACAHRAHSAYKEGKFKCSASEALSVYPLIQKWITEAVKPAVLENPVRSAACDCYLQLCVVLGMLKATQRKHHNVTPSGLHRAIVACLRKFLVAFGAGAWIPKCHMALHFGWFLQTFGFLISCFVHERKHKVAKRYGNHMSSLRGFDKYVLREVFLTQRAALRKDSCFSIVQHLSRPTKKCMAALREHFPHAIDLAVTAEACVGEGGKVSKGDVVALEAGGVAQVWMHVVVDRQVVSCIARWRRVNDTTYIVRSEPEFIATSSIREALVYSRTGDRAVIIPPLAL